MCEEAVVAVHQPSKYGNGECQRRPLLLLNIERCELFY